MFTINIPMFSNRSPKNCLTPSDAPFDIELGKTSENFLEKYDSPSNEAKQQQQVTECLLDLVNSEV